MSNIKVNADSFADTLADILTKYGEDAIEGVFEAIDTTAEELVQDLKNDSPDDGIARKPKYKKGWKATEMYKDSVNKRVAVHNANAYPLTHLLENGHAKVNGGRVDAQVHIAPNEEKAVDKLIQRVEEAAEPK